MESFHDTGCESVGVITVSTCICDRNSVLQKELNHSLICQIADGQTIVGFYMVSVLFGFCIDVVERVCMRSVDDDIIGPHHFCKHIIRYILASVHILWLGA